MGEKIVGVLGGMGPEATHDFFGKLIRSTRASKDQEHLRVLIDNNTKVPDRTAAVLGRGPSPVPALRGSLETLARAGAAFAVIPCVSAHVFLEDLRRDSPLPILSIFDVVARAVVEAGVRRVGLVGTTGTVRGGFFQARLALDRIETLVTDEAGQERTMAAIYDIKNLNPPRPRSAMTADLVSVSEGLVRRGAGGIVAGCTEIPLALSQRDLDVPYFDAVLLLARAAVVEAGGALA